MAKLKKNSPLGALTKEAIDTYKADLKNGRNAFPPPQTITDAELKTWEKMGPAKRDEYGKVLTVFEDHNGHIAPPLSISNAQINLSVFDGADEIIAAHQAEIDYWKRRKTIAGALALNMIKMCEAETENQVGKDNEAAILAEIELNKIPRSAKGGAANKNKSDDPTIPKTDK